MSHGGTRRDLTAKPEAGVSNSPNSESESNPSGIGETLNRSDATAGTGSRAPDSGIHANSSSEQADEMTTQISAPNQVTPEGGVTVEGGVASGGVGAGGVGAVARPAVGSAISAWLAAWRERLVKLFSVDLRSLAVLRIALGVLLLVDLYGRSANLTAHYTDQGVLPRSLLFESEGFRAYLSLHALSGSLIWQAVLFGLAGYFAFTLILGIRTRLATVASWLLLLSLHHRNPVILQSGDTLLRLLLFWAMMLPLGARWSVDSAASPLVLYHRKDNRLLSVAGVAILLQVCLVYWFTVTFKDHPMWWKWDAARYALNVDQLVTPLGLWIRQIDWLLPILTFTAFGLAIAAPILAFCPVWTGTARMLVIIAMIGTHLALAMSLKLGLLPYVAAASWLVFIPTQWWDYLKHRGRRHRGLKTNPSRSLWLIAILKRLPVTISSSRRGTGDVLIDIPTNRQRGIRARGWEQVVASLALMYVVAWNVQWLDANRDKPAIPVRVAAIGDVLRMEQGWNMIPRHADVLNNDGWFMMPAELADGSHMDLYTGRPINWSDPNGPKWSEPDARWRRYLRNIAKPQFKHHLHRFAEYLARNFNDHHSPTEQLVAFKIIYLYEKRQPDGEIAIDRQTLLAYHH